MFNFKACRKTGLGFNQFFGGFLNFKISKRPRPLCLGPRKDRDRSPVLIRFSPVRSPVFYRSLRPDLETLLREGGGEENGPKRRDCFKNEDLPYNDL